MLKRPDGKPIESRNLEVLADFYQYCLDHPQERFWQALRNWAGVDFVYVERAESEHDTFYWEKRNG